VADDDETGVPVIAPVAELIDKPEGSDGETEKVIGDVPPLAVTGVSDVATALAVSVSAAIAKVVESAAETVREKVFVAVTDAESVTVTVYVVAELVTEGVPVIAPVELLMDKPEGSPGLTV
jgi:exonuclease I